MKSTKDAAEDALQQMFGTKPKKPQWKPNPHKKKVSKEVSFSVSTDVIVATAVLLVVLSGVGFSVYKTFFAKPNIKLPSSYNSQLIKEL